MKNKQAIFYSFFLFLFGGMVFSASVLAQGENSNGTGEGMGAKNVEKKTIQAEERNEKMQEKINNREEKREEIKEQRQIKTCETFAKEKMNFLKNIDVKQGAFLKRIQNREQVTMQMRNQTDSTYEQKVQEALKNRQRIYEKLLSEAKTQEQKDAVEKFQKTMETLALNRQTEVATARKNYRASWDALVTDSYKEQVNTFYATYEESIRTAIETATKSCEGGQEFSEIRTQLKTDLSGAREALSEMLKQFGSETKSQRETARNAYLGAIKKANDTYKTGVKDAVSVLKSVYEEVDDIF
ncbi:MAG: hypothetical protein IPN70_01765 [Candidatus Moraniibacteriota bacterium]|nr:MAG: hypothetical protein IPN70_01765 [Candidatus Moranbacteria bacterium]